MSLETETVLDRRRLRRRLSLWRGLAVIAAALAVGFLALGGEKALDAAGRKQIARVAITGMITEDREQLKLLKRIEEASHVAGVILFVNSPGGTTTGGEALYEAVRKLSSKKPVVAQFGTTAASAAYIAGLATDHIVARGNTITGSVGVIFQWPEVSQMLDKLGVKMNEIKSGPLKANPSPFQPIDEAGRKLTEAMIAESKQWFVELVASRRGVDTRVIDGLEQGRVFSGREAARLRLVDEIGGEPEAVRWLETEKNLPKGLRVVDWKPKSELPWSFAGAAAGLIVSIAREAGLPVRLSEDSFTLGRLSLDGLVSVWQFAEN